MKVFPGRCGHGHRRMMRRVVCQTLDGPRIHTRLLLRDCLRRPGVLDMHAVKRCIKGEWKLTLLVSLLTDVDRLQSRKS